MATTIRRRPTSFRLRTDLVERLKRKAADEPNEVTKAAIEEARNRKDYPESELYGSAKEMFEAMSKENEENLSVGAV